MNWGSCSSTFDISTATDIGPSQYSTKSTSLPSLSIEITVNRDMSPWGFNDTKNNHAEKMEEGEGVYSIYLFSFTGFLLAVKKNGCIGWSYETGGPITLHLLRNSRLRFGHLLSMVPFFATPSLSTDF